MLGSATLSITEWDWLKVQLRLMTLETNGSRFVTRYFFRDHQRETFVRGFSDAQVHCSVWCKTTDDLIKRKAARSEHLDYYTGWFESEEQRLTETLTAFPRLSKEFDLHRHIVYTILHSYGMGSAVVCHFYDGKVQWVMSTDQIPE